MQNTEQIPFTDTFAPMLLPMQGPRANKMLGKDETITGAKKLAHRIRLKSILFHFLAEAIIRSKKRNRMRYMCILYGFSLHFHLPSLLSGLANSELPAKSKL